MKETKEYCDCCGQEIAEHEDGVKIYRREISLFRRLYWPIGATDTKWQTVCSDCWDKIGEMVKEAGTNSPFKGPRLEEI